MRRRSPGASLRDSISFTLGWARTAALKSTSPSTVMSSCPRYSTPLPTRAFGTDTPPNRSLLPPSSRSRVSPHACGNSSNPASERLAPRSPRLSSSAARWLRVSSAAASLALASISATSFAPRLAPQRREVRSG